MRTNPLHTVFTKLLILPLSLVSIVGCTPSLVTHRDFDPTANFGQYRNYAWYNAAITGLEQQQQQQELVDKSIRTAIESELVKKGMLPANDDPDILLAYYVSVGGQQPDLDENRTASVGYGFTGIPNFRDAQQYEPGTLIIDLIDPVTNELVWRGWAAAEIDLDNLDDTKITRAVVSVLAQYPPGARVL